MIEDRDELRFKTFLASVLLHSNLATCDRLRTATGIINDKRLRGIGFNGSINGMPHCDDIGHVIEGGHCIATRHGEVNAISNTDRQYLRGGQAIVLATPCFDCVKNLIQEGVTRIDYLGSYDNSKGKDLIEALAATKGVELVQHEIELDQLFQELFDQMIRKGGILNRAGYRLRITKEPL